MPLQTPVVTVEVPVDDMVVVPVEVMVEVNVVDVHKPHMTGHRSSMDVPKKLVPHLDFVSA